jgi:hypothetical protein
MIAVAELKEETAYAVYAYSEADIAVMWPMADEIRRS